LNGLSLASGRQHVDNATFIDHAVPHCTSHELYKTMLDDEATAGFTGRILVRQDAQKTDAHQSNKTLLLSPKATMSTRPQLQIYADDVKCTHGAAVGQLDDNAVFYLLSRGIDRQTSRALLSYAFGSEVVEGIPLPAVQAALQSVLRERLGLAPEDF
jgi:Fe-S cluster assembly protein SufD